MRKEIDVDHSLLKVLHDTEKRRHTTTGLPICSEAQCMTRTAVFESARERRKRANQMKAFDREQPWLTHVPDQATMALNVARVRGMTNYEIAVQLRNDVERIKEYERAAKAQNQKRTA